MPCSYLDAYWCASEQLDVLILLAILTCFGTKSLEALEEEGTLFAHLTHELSLDLRAVWTPAVVFFKALRRRRLVEIAEDVRATRWRPSLGKAGQGELALDLAEKERPRTRCPAQELRLGFRPTCSCLRRTK